MRPSIHELPDWPWSHWNDATVTLQLSAVRFKQGRLVGRMEGLDVRVRDAAIIRALTDDVRKTSEIEGESLDEGRVRSALARRLGIGIDTSGLEAAADDRLERVVEMMLDATGGYDQLLTEERLVSWHAASAAP